MTDKATAPSPWFDQPRLGMFVHWGIYAIPAWHEQLQWRGRMSRAEYVKFADQWNPVRFEPEAWLDLAQEVGMQYLCITAKHHDGFCLWDTAQTPFNTMNTPYGKDILGMLADACHRRDFPLFWYYSCADWHHPNYPNQGRHHELPGPEPGDAPDLDKYLEFLKAQVRELCTNYGRIHGFWWDMNVPQHRDPSINAMIRELQPGIVINDRGYDEGDFGTPERDYQEGLDALRGFERPTEACQSVGIESWGFRRDEDYYTDRHLVRSIDRYMARGAHYLLNVGPTAEGVIPPQAVQILRRVGAWFGRIRESVEDVEPAPGLVASNDVLLTRRGNTVYVHLHRDNPTAAVKLNPLAVMPVRAKLLNTGAPVDCSVDLLPSEHASGKPCLRMRNLPVNMLANTCLVVRLDFDVLPEGTAPSEDTPEVLRM